MEASEWTRELDFNHSLIISLAIHIVLVTILPGISPRELPPSSYIEVTLQPPPPEPVKPPSKPVEEKSSLAGTAGKKIGGGKKTAEAWRWQPLPAGVKSGGEKSNATNHTRAQEAVPMVDLPAKSQSGNKEHDPLRLPGYPTVPVEEIGASVAKAAPSALEGAIGPADISQGIGGGGPAVGKGGSGLVFDWTGKPRRTMYEPAKPRYSSAVEGTVEAKIWVDADGHVANAMVLKKLDTVLEQLALDYIKQCRFEPLKIKDDKLQTGVAKFYFKLE